MVKESSGREKSKPRFFSEANLKKFEGIKISEEQENRSLVKMNSRFQPSIMVRYGKSMEPQFFLSNLFTIRFTPYNQIFICLQ